MGNYEGNGLEGRIGLDTTVEELITRERRQMPGRVRGFLERVHNDRWYSRTYLGGKKISTIRDLTNLTDYEVLQIPNFGVISFNKLNSMLSKYGLPTISSET